MGFNALLSSTETMLFIVIIFTSAIFFHVKFNKFSVAHGPEILTTLGIFGCFISIALALLNLNSADLMNSIPVLLDGIKTAFCASVVGVGGALSIKIRQTFRKKPIPQSEDISTGASFDDVVSSISSLQKGLVGNEEGTLLSQMKLLRNDTNDNLKNLADAFNKFATHMVENNQKAIIEALKQVISDFNKNLTEQFGENFKQLNEGVGLLVKWQQQYKDELEVIKQAQLQAATDMKIASEAFGTIVKNSEAFANIAEKLKTILEALSIHKDVLFEQEKALSALMIQMKDVTPEFAIKMTTMLNEITTGINKVQSETSDVVKKFGIQMESSNDEMKKFLTDVIYKTQQYLTDGVKESSKIIKDSVESRLGELKTGVAKIQSETSDVVKNFGAQAQSANAELKNLLTEVVSKSQQQLSDGLQENSNIIKQGVLALDKELQKGLNDSLTSLGKQLASLSEKFVEDYLPLTEKLRELVRMASRA